MAAPPAPVIILTPFTCGWLTRPASPGLDVQPGETTVPVTAYLIDHPAGKAVFDTGAGPRFARLADEPASRPLDLEEDALIDARLRAVGVAPSQITYILNSHLHSDHAGANALLPAASVIVQEAEWQYAAAGTDGAYHAPDFDTGQPVMTVTAEYDVFHDGSVVLVPTPGHTPGHQSARVQTSSGEVVLAGGACDTRRSLDELLIPARSHDPVSYRRSLTWFRARERAGATIAFGHDPDFWATVPQSVPWHPVPPQ